MYESSQSEFFEQNRMLTERDTLQDYIAMGYTPGTARQLAHLNEHLLRDIGLDRR